MNLKWKIHFHGRQQTHNDGKKEKIVLPLAGHEFEVFQVGLSNVFVVMAEFKVGFRPW